jgi:hypothetical protein
VPEQDLATGRRVVDAGHIKEIQPGNADTVVFKQVLQRGDQFLAMSGSRYIDETQSIQRRIDAVGHHAAAPGGVNRRCNAFGDIPLRRLASLSTTPACISFICCKEILLPRRESRCLIISVSRPARIEKLRPPQFR